MRSLKIIVPTTLLLVILVSLFVIGYNKEYQENKRYQSYLSVEVLNSVSSLIYGTIESNDLLDEVVQSNKITQNQSDQLNERLKWIVNDGIKTGELARLTSKYGRGQNKIIDAASKIQYYLQRQFRDNYTEQNHEAKLNTEQLQKLKGVKKLNQMWVNEIEKNLKGVYVPDSQSIVNGEIIDDSTVISREFNNSLYKNGINRNDWISYYITLSQITDKNESLYESLY